MQQLHKDYLLLDQIEVLNTSCKNKGELLLNILFKEILIIVTMKWDAIVEGIELDNI